jgi:D-sedoheptulose 7-phosphate isomerase
MTQLTPVQTEILDGMLERRPDLEPCVTPLLKLVEILVACYVRGGTLFTCGNGGSCADALHIAGEMVKSFEAKRPISQELASRLEKQPFGADLAQHLEAGFRCHPLGFSTALTTAIDNDSPMRDIAFAQELSVFMRPGDVLLAISTSGNAANCLMALSVAKAQDGFAAALTGPHGGQMAENADLIIKAPGQTTAIVQESHITLWHTLCLLTEARYFPERRC